MDSATEIFSEDKERAKTYLEKALKILGICQIAAGTADIFWNGGFNFTMLNSVIVGTGFIFFLGSIALREPLDKLKEEEHFEEERLKFKSDSKISYAKAKTREEYFKRRQENNEF